MEIWIKSIVGLTLIFTLLLFIIPKNSIGKMIKGVFSALLMMFFIAPVLNINDFFESIDQNFSAVINIQEDFVFEEQNRKNEVIIKAIKEELQKNDIKTEEVFLTVKDKTNTFSIDKIEIKLKNQSFIGDKLHNDIIEIVINLLSDRFVLTKEQIKVYE